MTAESFDDGQAGVPAAVAGPVERVVVIGAGIAGLTVANALTHGGVECVVVEARDRIGGRLHTVNLAGSMVDLGGSWIHTPVGNPMRAFADRAGVRCRSANPLPELAGFDCGEGRRLSAAEVETNISLQLEDFPQARGRLLAELGPDASAADGIEAFVAGAGLAPGPARRARQGMHALVEGESADLAERQSLRWMWNEMEYEGHYFGDVPVGGYRRLVEAMAADVDLRLGVGANPADADLLGEPADGRLLFAGEHTQSARLAYADGAMTSGIREAKRLLGQPAIHLGPIR